MKSRDPSPRQRIGGRITVEQMPVNEVCAQHPWQLEGKDPDAGEPHAGVIVQITGLCEFFRPGIKAGDAGVPALGSSHFGREAIIGAQLGARTN
jgi:hypothetical protein